MPHASPELDSFDQYLHDIARYTLIDDPEEERRLAHRAREGDEEAAERLITANLRFVISYVKRYQGRGLDLPELVCLGNAGLLEAAERFDPERGTRFITYAVWWIRHSIVKALAEQARSVRIPQNKNSTMIKMSQAETALTQKLGRAPTDQELADRMDEASSSIRRLRAIARTELRLDAPIDATEREGGTIGERFPGTGGKGTEKHAEHAARRKCLEEMIDRYLTERERKIVYLYYGLDERETQTLEEIGELLGVSRERVRQIKGRALDRLRRPSRARRLRNLR